MKKRLFFFVPLIERGDNDNDSYSRSNYYLIEVRKNGLPWSKWVDAKTLKGEDVTLTIKGVKALIRLAEDKRVKAVEFYDGKQMYQLSFRHDVNGGFDGEKTLSELYPEFIKASTTDDKDNGIDFYLFNEPCQLKTVCHGITEYCNNVIDGQCKKSGLSKINCKLDDLINWDFMD